MSELSKLMVKAVRSLPPEEQDALLEAMLEPRLAPWPTPGGPGLPPLPSPDLLTGQVPHPIYGHGYGVTLPPLGPETGGPWQSVPVRLSTDQHERLKQWCQANGFTMAVVLRGLVARFLDDQATRRPTGGQPDPPPPGQPATPSRGQSATQSPGQPEPAPPGQPATPAQGQPQPPLPGQPGTPSGGQPGTSAPATEPPGGGA